MGKLADSAFPGIVDVVEQEEERFLIMEWIEESDSYWSDIFQNED